MALGIGAYTEAAIIEEASYAAGGTYDTFLELRAEETVQKNQEKIDGDYLFGSPILLKTFNGVEAPAGVIPIVANPDNIPVLMFLSLGAEAAASQVGSTTAYDHDFTPAGSATDLKSFAFEIHRDLHAFEYVGGKVNSVTFKAAKGSFVHADFDCIFQTEDDTHTWTDAVAKSTKLPYSFHMATLKIDTAAVAYVNSCEITHSWNLDVEGCHRMDGNAYIGEPWKTVENISGSLGCEWTSTSDVLRDAYLDNTAVQVTLEIVSTEEIETGYYYTLTIDIPITYFIGDPPVVSDRGRIPFTANFVGAYDSTNNIKITTRDASNSVWKIT
jgi:hypothetical protein